MAFNKDDRDNLEKIAKATDTNNKIKLPSGNKDDDKEEEIQYSMMDMIIGLCGASMFGQKSKNRSNINELLSNPLHWTEDVESIKNNIKDLPQKIDNFIEIKDIVNEIKQNNIKTYELLNKEFQIINFVFSQIISLLTNAYGKSDNDNTNTSLNSLLETSLKNISVSNEVIIKGIDQAVANSIAATLENMAPKAIIEFIIKAENLKLDDLNELLKNINSSNINSGIVEDFKNLKDILQELDSAFANIHIDNMKSFSTMIKTINVKNMKDFIDALSIDSSKLDKIKNIEKIFEKISKINKQLELIGKGSTAITAGFNVIKTEAKLIKDIVKLFDDIDENKLKEITNTLNAFTKIIAVAGATLAFGALIVTFVPITKIITFGLTLAALVSAITVPILILDKYGNGKNNKIYKGMEQLAKLVAVCGMTLALGSLITMIVPFSAMIKFSLLLTGLVIGVSLPLLYIKANYKHLHKGLEALTKLIVGTATVLMIGALFVLIPGMIQATLGFGILLTGFILLITGAYKLGTNLIKGQIADITGLGYIIMGTAAALMVGGLFMMIPGMAANVIKFGLLLTGFVLLITTAYSIGTMLLKHEMRYVDRFVKLILVSAGALLIGGLFMMIPGMPKATLEFALLLGGFVVITTIAFGVVSHLMDSKKSIVRDILVLSLLIAITAAAMTFGPIFLKLAGVGYGEVFLFLTSMVVCVGLMAAIVYGLSQIDKEKLIAGGLIVLAIAGVMLAMTYVMKLIGETVTKYPMHVIMEGLLDMITLIGVMAGITAVIALIYAATTGVGAAVIAGALATILAIAGVLYAVNEIIVSIANSGMLSINIDLIISQIYQEMKLLGVFGLFVSAVGLLCSNPLVLIGIGVGSAVIMDIAGLITITSLAVMTLSKAVNSVKGLTPENVELLPTFLSLFMFGKDGKQGIFGILDKLTLFDGVFGAMPILGAVNAVNGASKVLAMSIIVKQIASMISDVSEAIEYFANLKAPIYDVNGKIIGYRQLDQSDFNNASEGIEIILTTIGNAINNTYENNKELFDGTGLDEFRKFLPYTALLGMIGNNDTPMARVVKSFVPVSTLISEMAKAISEYANLTYTEYEQNGNSIKKNLDRSAFKNASDNIELVLTTIGKTINDVYNNNTDLFDGNGWDTFKSFTIWGLIESSSGKDTPFNRVVTSFMPVTTLISEMSKAISEFANLTYTEYDERGNGTKKNMKIGDFSKASNNISLVMTTIASAINNVYRNNKELFDGNIIENGIDTFLSAVNPIYGLTNAFKDKDTPMAKVVKSFLPVATMISEMGKAITEYANLTYTEYNPDGSVKSKKRMDDGEFKKASQSIGKVMKTIMQAVTDAYYSDKTMFDGALMGLGDSPIEKVGNAMKPVSEMIVNLATAIKDYSSMKMPFFNESTGEIEKDKFKKMNDADFINASQNIKTVITTIFDAMNKIVEDPKYEEYFDFFGDTPSEKVADAIKPSVELISTLSNIIQQYAEMKIPYIDDNGLIVDGKFTKINFSEVSGNIGTIITTLFDTIDTVYTGKEKLFESGFLESSPIQKIGRGVVPIIDLLSSLTSVIQQYAEMKIPFINDNGEIQEGKYEKIDFIAVSNNIKSILTCLFEAVSNAYTPNLEKMVESTYLGLGDSPIQKISKAMVPIGGVLHKLTKAIIDIASAKIGKEQLNTEHIKKTKDNIKEIISTIFTGVDEAYNKIESEIDFDNIEKINKYFGPTSKTILNIASLIKQYSTLTIPYFDETTKQFDKSKLTKLSNEEITAAGTTIGTVLTTISSAILGVTKANGKELDLSKITKITAVLNPANKMISEIGKALAGYASEKVVTKFDSKGNPIAWEPLGSKERSNAISEIQNIITAIGTAIVDVANQDTNNIFENGGILKPGNKAGNVVNAITKISSVLNGLAITVAHYAAGKFPTLEFKDGKLVQGKPIKLEGVNYDDAKTNISKVLKTICGSIIDIYKDEEINNFITNTNKDDLSKVNIIVNSINNMGKMIENINSAFINLKKTFEESKIDPAQTFGQIKEMLINLQGNDKTTGIKGILNIINEMNNFLDPSRERIEQGGWTMIKESVKGLGGLQEKTKSEKTESVTGAITQIVGQLTAITDTISLIGKITVPNTTTITNTLENINSLFGTIFDKASNKSSLKKTYQAIDNFDIGMGIDDETADVINVINNAIKIVNKLRSFNANSNKLNPQELYSNISSINDLILGSGKEEEKGLISIFESFGKIYDTIKENDLFSTLGIGAIITSISDLSENMTKWTAIMKDISSNKESVNLGVQTFINSINTLSDIKFIEKIQFNLGVIKNALDSLLKENHLSNWKDIIIKYHNESIIKGSENFVTSLQAISQAIDENLSDEKNKLFNEFSGSLSLVLNTIGETITNSANTQFKKHTETLEKYVKSVNSIDVKKVESLTTLVKAMLALSNRLGNIDKLNETLAKKLSVVLKDLSDKLTEAKNTIKEADKLHEKRKELINKSVSTIQTLLKQDMTVTVKSDQEDVETPTDTPSDTNTGQTPQNNLGEDGNRQKVQNGKNGQDSINNLKGGRINQQNKG